MITLTNITHQFGVKPLFENINIKFTLGNKYGLIGANGSGKSTLMKILNKELEPSAGNIDINVNLRIGKLNQDHFVYEDKAVLDVVIMGHKKLMDIKTEREKIYALPEMSEKEGIRVAELESEFAMLDGYTAEAKAGELLLGLDIPLEAHTKTMSEIPNDWKIRTLLAQALFDSPDILLLDEPTNNLDINTIRWLESVLQASNALMIIISHDRHFLNSVCTHMADLDYGQLKIFPGNYDDFMFVATMVRERMQQENAKKYQKIEELKNFVSRFSANASKAKQATSRLKQLDKIVLEEIKPSSRVNPYIIFEQDKKLYRNALEVSNFTKKFGKLTLWENLSFQLEVGKKLAIIGANGVGKTSLLKALIGALPVDAGEIKWSENVTIGYFAQDHKQDFNQEIDLIKWMEQWKKPKDDNQLVRSILGRMLFSANDIKKSVKVLSGGEQARMLFGKIIMQRPNILIMDEPTNHLDMESIESLNLALENYKGTVIFVSHDREFVSSIATKIIEIKPNGCNHYNGNYEDYLTKQEF